VPEFAAVVVDVEAGAAVVVVLPVVVEDVGAVEPSRRCITGGASELSEFTVVSMDVSGVVVVELEVLWVVEVDAGRAGSGQELDCEAFAAVLLEAGYDEPAVDVTPA
jgi:hypothetical protein